MTRPQRKSTWTSAMEMYIMERFQCDFHFIQSKFNTCKGSGDTNISTHRKLSPTCPQKEVKLIKCLTICETKVPLRSFVGHLSFYKYCELRLWPLRICCDENKPWSAFQKLTGLRKRINYLSSTDT
ncbi:hypothetical protein NL108_016748 [Boleophthalmus pectinirostris]|nr:hypothetical protein NL108_016748 [Boleophthalmus pectinirostris]